MKLDKRDWTISYEIMNKETIGVFTCIKDIVSLSDTYYVPRQGRRRKKETSRQIL